MEKGQLRLCACCGEPFRMFLALGNWTDLVCPACEIESEQLDGVEQEHIIYEIEEGHPRADNVRLWLPFAEQMSLEQIIDLHEDAGE